LPQNACGFDAEKFAIFCVNPFDQRLEQYSIDYPVNLHVVDLIQVRFRGEHSCRPLRIIGQQQQTFTRLVQSSHRRYEWQRLVRYGWAEVLG